MGYGPVTRNGHNMFEMTSLLQKAIRRSEKDNAGYAAAELFGGYDSLLWKRLIVVSAEDCWGVLTKEIVRLCKLHKEANEGLKGYYKKTGYVSVAVSVLCDAFKSRDACYYSCNFIMSDNTGTTDFQIDMVAVQQLKNRLTGEIPTLWANLKNDVNETDIMAWILYESIGKCDMENSGYALRKLVNQQELIWKVLYQADEDFTHGRLSKEIEALHFADEFVNKKKAPEERDPLFISKAIIILMYEICGKFKTIFALPQISYDGEIDYESYPMLDIRKCELRGMEIPEYVYDVHTIRGKKAGHTDWEMNLVENDALKPLQPAFFEEGSWELRYDYKHRNQMCTAKEYAESLEYRKTHLSNPARRFLGIE